MQFSASRDLLRTSLLLALGAFSLFGVGVQSAAAQELGSGRLLIAGTRLTVAPAQQTVPFDTPTVVTTTLEGYDPARGVLPPQLRVLADLSGPEISGILVLETVPNEPFRIPRLRLEGLYSLDNIRLVEDGEILAFAEPRTAEIDVRQILLSRVSSRALTLDEIRAYGLKFGEDSFQGLNLTFAFGVDGETVEYNLPVVYDLYGPDVRLGAEPSIALPAYDDTANTVRRRFQAPRMIPFAIQRENREVTRPPSGGCDPREECRQRTPPEAPMVGVLLFPTDIGLLHQFFSVVLMVQNGAPEGDALEIRDLLSRIVLPPGLRLRQTEPPTVLGTPVPVQDPGPDGEIGTADDLNFIVAQASGEIEALVEGAKEGTHVVRFEMEGVLEGLPSGPQPVSGAAEGAVAVRDPRLAVHVAHPQVVRADIEYPLYMTLSNVGTAPVNLISLRLPSHAVSGVEILDGDTRTIDELLPGDSEVVEFRVLSRRTGKMVSSSVKTGSSIDPSFEWSVKVGESGALSPDSLALPRASENLPDDLRRQALALVGLGYSLAEAPPALDSGLPRVGLDAVNERIYRLAQAGRHYDFGEELFDVAAILATEWLGARDEDWPWDDLRRQHKKGADLAASTAAAWSAAEPSVGEVFERFAATTHFLAPQAALAAGAGTVLEVKSRTSGKTLAGSAYGDPDWQRDLPFAELYGLGDGEMAVMAVPEDGGYEAVLRRPGGGSGELRLLLPNAAGAGDPRLVSFGVLTLASEARASVTWSAADTSFTLELDDDGDGIADQQIAGIVTDLPRRPFSVLAAVQNPDADASGHVVDVMLSEDVDLASMVPRDPARFEVAGNISNGGLVQAEADAVGTLLTGTTENPLAGFSNPRLVRVAFENPLSPLEPQSLTVRDLLSASGDALSTSTVTVEARPGLDPGVRVSGTVYGHDGQPVPFAELVLWENDLSGTAPDVFCTEHPTAAVVADANGQFTFDYVRQTACGSVFRLRAKHPSEDFFGDVSGVVRLLGQDLELDLRLPGRGKIHGQVRYDDGAVPASITVVASHRERDQGRMAHVDDNGFYDVDHLITGTITLAADDGEGHFVYKTVELPGPGAVVEQDLILLRRGSLSAVPPPGRVEGVVRHTDGTPVFDAYVALYVDGVLTAVERSGLDGGYDFGLVPAGVAEIEVWNEASAVTGAGAARVYFEVEPDGRSVVEILLRDVSATIEGQVLSRRWDGQLTPIEGAVVWLEGTPFNTVTDANGFYSLDEVFEGTWRVRAYVAATNAGAAESVSITSGTTGVVERDLYLDEPLPQGGLIGQVLDFDGSPEPGATVHLSGGYTSTRWHHEATTDAEGRFFIADLAPGRYGVHAISSSGGGVGFAEIDFPGDTAWVTVRYRQGLIRVKTLAENSETGANLPVVSQVAYRKTEVVGEWQLVVLGRDYVYEETAPEDGVLEIPALVGPYEIHVFNSFHGSRSFSGQLDFDGQVVEHEVIFEPNGLIGGTVLDHDGVTPVAGARLELSGGSIEAFDVMTDEAGRFEFPLLPPAFYVIEVFAENGSLFRRAETVVGLRDFGQEIRDVEIVLPAQGTVYGWVETASAAPVPGAVVTLVESSYPHRRLEQVADTEGNFAFDNVFAGDVTLYAQAPELGGLGGRTAATVTMEAEDVLVAVTLEPVGEVVGRVTSPVDGLPVPQAEVRLVDGYSLLDIMTTDAAGEFRSRLLPLGFYQARVFDPASGRRGSSAYVEVTENGVAVLDVLLEKRGIVDGHFRDSDTNGTVPGAIVRLRVSGRLNAYGTTDQDGYYEFGGIPEEIFYLDANDPSGRRHANATGEIVAEDERLTVDLVLAPTSRVFGSVLNPPGLAAGLFANANTRVVQRGQILGAGFDNPYAFEGLSSETSFEVIATENGGLREARAKARISEAGTDVELDLTMPAMGTARVEVRDSFGTPVSGADVSLHNAHATGQEFFSGSTGADHVLDFGDIREGGLYVSVRDPVSGLRGSARGTLDSEGENVVLQVALQDTGTVRGRAVLSDGVTPAAFATVSVDRGGFILGTADENGYFEFEALPLGEYSLVVQQDEGPGMIERFGSLSENGQVDEWGTLVLDDEPPVLLDVQPPSGTVNLPLDTVFTLTFSEPMDVARQGEAIWMREVAGFYVNLDFTWSADQTSVVVTPQAPLDSGTAYDLFVDQAIYDLAGRSLDWRARATFQTADVIPPAVIDTLPRHQDVEVPIDSTILITFSEPVDELSLSGSALQLTDLTTGEGVTTTFQLRPDQRQVILTPQAMPPARPQPMFADRQMEVRISGVVDLAGNAMAAPVVTTFWTPDETLPELAWTSPAAGQTFTAGDPVAIAATASDNRGVARVDYQVGEWTTSLDGGAVVSGDFTWNVPAPVMSVAGDVVITALVVDVFGNEQSFTRTITVEPRQNASAPFVDSGCPRDGDLVAPGLEIPVSYSMSDDEAIESLWLEVDGTRITTLTPVDAPSASGTFPWTPPASAAAGQIFDLRLGARDFAGNVTEHAVSLAVPTGTLLVGDQAIDASHAGASLALAAGTFTWSESVSLAGLTVLHGGVLQSAVTEMEINATGSVKVQCGGLVDASETGYPGGDAAHPAGYAPDGLALPTAYTGGSHGGLGAIGEDGDVGEIYDSVYLPVLAGGGGGGDGSSAGGGVLQVTAASMVIDGEVRARGGKGLAGGAGGSVTINAASLAGIGLVDASGGDGGSSYTSVLVEFGGGGGGRVALYVDDLSGFDVPSQARARGGILSDAGGSPGTVYVFHQTSTYGSLIVDAGPDVVTVPSTELPALGSGSVSAVEVSGADLWVSAASPLRERWGGVFMKLTDAGSADLGTFRVAALDANGRALLAGAGAVTGAAGYSGEYRFDDVTVGGAADLVATDPLFGGALVLDGETEVSGLVTATDVLVKSGARVRPASGNELVFEVSGTLTVEAGAVIDVDGLGYAEGDAAHPTGYGPPGIATSGPDAGASHGGAGRLEGAGPVGEVYGSVYEPELWGAGAPYVDTSFDLNADGGGRILIDADRVVLDGTLSARGGEGYTGGAGGSILVRAGELTGSGLVDASGARGANVNEGAANFGAGGGGRVALYADQLTAFDPATQARAWGGPQGTAQTQGAAPGTVYVFDQSATYGLLIVDSGSATASVPDTELPALGSGAIVATEPAAADLWMTGTAAFQERWRGVYVELLDASGTSLGYHRVGARDENGRLLLEGAGALGAAASYRGEYRFDEVQARNTAQMVAGDLVRIGSLVIENDLELAGEIVVDSLTIKSGATVRPAAGGTLDFRVSGTMTVEAGGVIDVSGLGYAGAGSDTEVAGSPAWVTPTEDGQGGSHGGPGRDYHGNYRAETWDSVYRPLLPGGGGGSAGNPGGGVLTVTAGELVLDGTILANANGTRGVGGAGGTVMIDAAVLRGGGSIEARGNGLCRQGGGGGRVALWVDDLSLFDPVQQVSALGGGETDGSCDYPRGHGGAGTVFVHTASSLYGDLRLDNGPDDLGDPRRAPVVELPLLGGSTAAAFESAGADAWLTTAAGFTPRWRGVQVALFDAAGDEIGEYRAAEIDETGRLLLEGAGAVSGAVSYEGRYRFDEVALFDGAELEILDPHDFGTVSLGGGEVALPGVLDVSEMSVAAGTTVRPVSGDRLELRVSGTLTVAAGAVLDVSGQGYSGAVDGVDATAPDNVRFAPVLLGGSHAGLGTGNGSDPPGETYGSVYQPLWSGGGGGNWNYATDGGNGGGVIDVVAGEVILDGELRATSVMPESSSGGGGSVFIDTPRLAGSGTIDASGAASCTRPGGGGRIALWVDDLTAFNPLLQARATSGTAGCASYGGAGTLFVHTTGSTFGDLWVRHDGDLASIAATPMPMIGNGTIGSVTGDSLEPTAAWIEPADPQHLFGLGVVGLWTRIGGVDYQVIDFTLDRRRLLLAGAAGATAAGETFQGVYKFDAVTVEGGARLEFTDFVDASTWSVDADSSLVRPDQEAPTIGTITPPEGSVFTAGDLIAVSATANDDVGVTEVRFHFDGQTASDTAAPYESTFTAPPVSQATDMVITVEALDAAGNVATATRTVHVEYVANDGAAPVVTYEGCLRDQDQVAPGTLLTFEFSASDNQEIESYALFIDAVEQQRVTVGGVTSVDATLQWTLPANAAPGQAFGVRLEARDAGALVGAAQFQLYAATAAALTGDQSLDATFNGQDLVLGNGVFTVVEPLQLTSLTLLHGAILRGELTEDLDLAVSGTMEIACGASIDVSKLGYRGATTTDTAEAPSWVSGPARFAGGSHGGRGAASLVYTTYLAGEIYDSVYAPSLAGGGGGRNNTSNPGSNGGGVLLLSAQTLVLEGEIRASGGDAVGGYRGAGAGGTVRLDVGTLSGSGLVDARGGDYLQSSSDSGGPGGGGRVAIYADGPGSFDALQQVRIEGGTGFSNSGTANRHAAPGTVYVFDETLSTYGDLLIDARSVASVALSELPELGAGSLSLFEIEGSDAWVSAVAGFRPRFTGAFMALEDASGTALGTFRVLQVDASGRALLEGAGTVTGAVAYRGEYRFDSVTLRGGAGFDAADPVSGGTVTLDGSAFLPPDFEADQLTVKSGAVLRPSAGGELTLTVSGTVTVEAGASIDVSKLGYRGATTTDTAEAPSWVSGPARFAGGSHGGGGAASLVYTTYLAGEIYDSVYAPSLAGGGGGRNNTSNPGSNGGGVLLLSAQTLVLEGEIRASGGDAVGGYRGAGAGGTVRLDVGTLSGSGLVDARGGDYLQSSSDSGGPGGGGRVAIYAAGPGSFDALQQVRIEGGTGFSNSGTADQHAAPGTVYVFDETLSTYGDLLIDARSVAPVALNELPELGAGSLSLFEIEDSDAWVSASSLFRPRFTGAFMALEDATGAALGSFRVLQVDAAGRALLEGAGEVTGAASYRGEYRFDSVTLRGGAGVDAADPVLGGTVSLEGSAFLPPDFEAGQLTVKSGAVLRPSAGGELALTVSGTVTVEAGASIDVSKLGYRGATTTDVAETPAAVSGPARFAGGSHGGRGAASPAYPTYLAGETYDSVYAPSLSGGGGGRNNTSNPGSNGGGVIWLSAQTLVLDGEIRAEGGDAMNGYRGAGAGGTVHLDVGTFTGAGLIVASGGDYFQTSSDWGGGGGGGRVAIRASDVSGFGLPQNVRAEGGTLFTNSGTAHSHAVPGSLFLFTNGTAIHGDLIIDQLSHVSGQPGVTTDLPLIGSGVVYLGTATGSDQWIEPAAAGQLFDLGVVGAWLRIGGVDYRVLDQSADRRQVLLEGAAGALTGGESFTGIYKFDKVTVRGGVTLEFLDTVEVGVWDIGPDSAVVPTP